MRFLIYAVAILLGAAIGAAAGFWGVWEACARYDELHSPGHPKAVQVGWIFCFVTIPLGAILGAIISFCAALFAVAFHRSRRPVSEDD